MRELLIIIMKAPFFPLMRSYDQFFFLNPFFIMMCLCGAASKTLN